mmetsp:Transcript_16553/g.22978  ORF Transcript_16553/g.22978 Transcript_16553/m.22978 type:complete len:354 (-) Transcript_16553:161-1222(-)
MTSVIVHSDSNSNAGSSNSDSGASSSGSSSTEDAAVPYYYIITEVKDTQGRDLAIAPSGGKVVLALLDYNDENQLWEKRKTDKDNTFAFVHKVTGQCMSIPPSGVPGDLVMTTIDHIEMNPLLTHFPVRDVAGHKVIDSLNGSQHIVLPNAEHHAGDSVISASFPGNTMLVPRLCWSFVEDTSHIKLDYLQFDWNQKNITQMDPMVAQVQHVTNYLDDVQTQKCTFSYDVIETYSFTDETGLKITNTLDIKVEFPPVTVSGSVSVETSAVFSTTTTQQTKKSFSYSVDVSVKPHTRVTVQSMIFRGQVDIPYHLKGVRILPNGVQKPIETHGLFRRVASYDMETVYQKPEQLN